MTENNKSNLVKLFCRLGFHKYRIIEVKVGFGASGAVETVECEHCGYTRVRRSKSK